MPIKLKKLIEMPHALYGDAGMDLSIEKYPIPQSEKKELLTAFRDGYLSAFSKKYKKWLLITPEKIRVISSPTMYTLPEYWEEYIVWDI